MCPKHHKELFLDSSYSTTDLSVDYFSPTAAFCESGGVFPYPGSPFLSESSYDICNLAESEGITHDSLCFDTSVDYDHKSPGGVDRTMAICHVQRP